MSPSESHVRRLAALAPYLSETTIRELIDSVQKHEVVWEVWPERQVFSGVIRQIGFDVDLLGVHREPSSSRAARDDSPSVRTALVRIADAIAPRGSHASAFEILSKRGLEYPRTTGPGLACVCLRLLHTDGLDHPVDTCQLSCLSAVERLLAALGAQAGKRLLGVGAA